MHVITLMERSGMKLIAKITDKDIKYTGLYSTKIVAKRDIKILEEYLKVC